MANASPRARFSKVDGVALAVSLCCAKENLSRRAMACLLRLRRSQLTLIEQSRGALVRIHAAKRPPWLNLAGACAESPLVGDFLSLFLLQLAGDYPEQGERLRNILHARRTGLDVASATRALWDGKPARDALLHATLWVAAKPLCEAVARAFLRHVGAPPESPDCPVCGGKPWARNGKLAKCGVCETAWPASFERAQWKPAPGPRARGMKRLLNRADETVLYQFDRALFAHAFSIGPMIALVRLLEEHEPRRGNITRPARARSGLP